MKYFPSDFESMIQDALRAYDWVSPTVEQDDTEYCKCNNPLTNEDEQRTGVCRECR